MKIVLVIAVITTMFAGCGLDDSADETAIALAVERERNLSGISEALQLYDAIQDICMAGVEVSSRADKYQKNRIGTMIHWRLSELLMHRDFDDAFYGSDKFRERLVRIRDGMQITGERNYQYPKAYCQYLATPTPVP